MKIPKKSVLLRELAQILKLEPAQLRGLDRLSNKELKDLASALRARPRQSNEED